MEEKQYSKLLEAISHASLEFHRWQQALAAIADAIGVESIGLSGQNNASGKAWGFMSGIDDERVTAYVEHYHAVNPIWKAAAATPVGTVQTDRMVIPFRSFAKTEFYNDFLVPQGHTSMASSVLRLEDGAQTILAVPSANELTARQMDVLKKLTPRLVSAIEINTRLALSSNAMARHLGQLDLTGQAAFIVDGDGKVLDANKAAQKLLWNGLPLDRRSQSPVFDEADCAKMRTAVRFCTAPGASHRAKEIVLTPKRRPALSGIVSSIAADVPWRLDAWPAALVLIAPQNSVDDVFKAFGFTPAEARFARELLKGDGVLAAAGRLGVARSTARTHLAHLFQKTHTNSQAELLLVLLEKK